MNFLRLWNERLARAETYFLLLIVLVMVFLSTLQIILRKLFNFGILWGDTFLRHLVLWVSFIGASIATKNNKHINIDLLNRLFSPKVQQFLQIVIHFFSTFIAILLTKASLTFVLDEREFGSVIFGNVPAWYFQVIIPIGFALMSARFLINAILTLVEFVQGAQTEQ